MFTERMRKLLTTPTEELGNAARFCVFQMKLWRHCVRQLILNRADQQAAALSYQTIFGIVPVVIVMLLIFQAIPASSQIGDKIKTMAYQQLHLTAVEIPSPDNPAATVKLTDHLETIFRKFFSEQSRGTATVLSTVFIIWAALALLSIIESTFNSICRVTRGRSFLGRIVNYWAILTLGPMLIALAIYVSTSFAAVREVRLAVAPTVLNYLLGVLGLFLLYQVMPNTRLSWKSTLWGSAVAALVWTGVKAGFGSYVVHFKPYATLYGAMALVPLSVLWIYITWLIVLFGLELTYTTQNLETLEDAERQIASRREDFFIGGDVLAMSIMAMVATAHSRRTGPVPAETICSKLNVPPELAQKMLSRLVSRGLLVRTSEPCDGYVPATEAANIRLSDIAVAVDEAGQNALLTAEATRRVRQETIERLAQHTLAELVE